jgi:SAM-dependent methyltransferase
MHRLRRLYGYQGAVSALTSVSSSRPMHLTTPPIRTAPATPTSAGTPMPHHYNHNELQLPYKMVRMPSGRLNLQGTVRVLVWRTRRTLHRRGWIGTARAALQTAVHVVTSARKLRRIAADGREWDRKYGVATAGIVQLGELRIESLNRDDGERYQGSHPARFRELINSIPANLTEYTFVDFGSGKGRALLLASEFPFKRVIGVEFSPELNDCAQQNLRRFPARLQRCRNIELVTADVVDYDLPLDPCVLYFYNPFGEFVLRRVLDNVRASVEQSPRPIFLVFVGAFPRQPVTEEATLVPVQHVGSKGKNIFQMVAANLAPPAIDMISTIGLMIFSAVWSRKKTRHTAALDILDSILR